MAEKLKIIPLGGLNEVGKNMTVYEYGGDILIADCGLGFPDDDMYGVDLVIPDFTYVVKNITKVRAVAITHGHEDHIGALAYLLREVNVPIFASWLNTICLTKLRFLKLKPVQHLRQAVLRLNLFTQITAFPTPLLWLSKHLSAWSSTQVTLKSTLRP